MNVCSAVLTMDSEIPTAVQLAAFAALWEGAETSVSGSVVDVWAVDLSRADVVGQLRRAGFRQIGSSQVGSNAPRGAFQWRAISR
jgi:hypothetical protein